MEPVSLLLIVLCWFLARDLAPLGIGPGVNKRSSKSVDIVRIDGCWETGNSCRELPRHKWGSIPGPTTLDWMSRTSDWVLTAVSILLCAIARGMTIPFPVTLRDTGRETYSQSLTRHNHANDATIRNQRNMREEWLPRHEWNFRRRSMGKLSRSKGIRRYGKKELTQVHKGRKTSTNKEIKKKITNVESSEYREILELAKTLLVVAVNTVNQTAKPKMSASSSISASSSSNEIHTPRYDVNPFSKTMPEPGSRAAPEFNGKNIHNFIKRWETLCKRCGTGAEDPQFVDELYWYCTTECQATIAMMSGYVQKNWAILKKQLLDTYRRQDTLSIRWTATTIARYFENQEKHGVEIGSIVSSFGTIATGLINEGVIQEWQACQLLIKGMPMDLSKQLVRTMKFESWEDYKAFNGKFEETWKEALELCNMEKLVTEARTTEEPNDMSTIFGSRPPSTTQPAPQAIPPRSQEQMVDDLIGKFSDLTLSQKSQLRSRVMSTVKVSDNAEQIERVVLSRFAETIRAQERENQHRRQLQPQQSQAYAPQPQQIQQPMNRPAGPNPRSQARTWECYYCEEQGHGQLACPALIEDEQRGWVHRDPRGRVALGRPDGPGGIIPNDKAIRDGLSKKDWVRRREGGAKARAYICDDDYESDDHEEVTGSSRSMYYAAGVRQNRNTAEEYRVIQDCGIVRKFTSDYPAKVYEKRMREANDRAGAAEKKQKTTAATGKPAEKPADKTTAEPVTRSPEPVKKRAAPKPRKTAEQAKGGVIHEVVGNGVVIRVMITDGQAITKIFRGKEDPVTTQVPIEMKEPGKVRNARIEEVDNEEDDEEDEEREEEEVGEEEVIRGRSIVGRGCIYHEDDDDNDDIGYQTPLYARSSPAVWGKIGGFDVEFVLDSGSEICVMSEDIYKEIADEVAFKKAEWEMISVDGGKNVLRKVCPNTPIDIHGVRISLPVFVSSAGPSQVLLGRPFETLSRMKTSNRNDGSCLVTIRSPDNKQEVNFVGCSARSPRDKRSVEAGNRYRSTR